jgi:type I restriction enzyme S subunit
MGADNWDSIRLGDHVNYFKGFAFKSQEYIEFGHPVVRVSNFTDRSIDLSGCNFISPTDVTSYEDYQIYAGDVIIATVGSWPANPESVVGKTIKVPNEANGALLNQNTLCLRATEQLDQRFMFYLLKDNDFQNYLIGGARGSANQASITIQSVFDYVFMYPPLPEQRAIAGILGALDDKIELNRRMNRTLESMARAVFRQWFIENEDVGNWEVKTIGNICEFAYGKGLKADGRNAGSIPVYGSNGQIGWHDEHLVKGPGIVVGRKGNPGIVTWAQKDFFPIDTTFYVVPKDKDISLHWFYYILIFQNLPDLGADSAVPGLNRNIAYMSDVNYPPHDLMKEYDDFAKSLFDKINANDEESRTLASLRDSLLPKLMRGEVMVKKVGIRNKTVIKHKERNNYEGS